MITVMGRARCLSVLTPWLAALLIAAPSAAQTSTIDRAIRPLRGALYAATQGARTSVVLVTGDGILVVDPMSFEFAQWLQSELKGRFPDQPVRYVVYSRVDFDRIGGAGLYNQTAEIVAAEEFNPSLEQSRAVLPPRYAMLDRNNSGVLERSELAAIDQSPSLLRADFNGDGHLTPNELWSGVLAAEASYGSQRVLTLGGRRVELIHPGPALGNDATVVYFPAERLAFTATFPSLTAPFVGRSSRPSAMAAWARTIASLDIDTLLSGEGETFTRSQVSDFSAYVTTLVTGVMVGYENGVSLEQLQNGTLIDRFSGTPFAATRNTDIAYVHRRTMLLMIDVEGSVLANHVPTDSHTCQSTSSCQVTSEDGLGAAASIALSVRRWWFAAEMSVGHRINITATGEGQRWFDSRNRRDTLISPLVGYRTSPAGTVNLLLLGGPTVARTSVDGASRGGFLSSPPLFPYAFSQSTFGITVGADLMVPLGSRVRFTIPMRLTKLPQDSSGYRTTINLRAGLGLTVSAWQHVD
jgi:hypothetical protein